MKWTGVLAKMAAEAAAPVRYHLTLGETRVDLTALVGQELRLAFTGRIVCSNCGKTTRKSYGQGFCYPCTMKLAECDLCILKPETCHYDKGTCREPAWGEEHCLKPHVVYLANSSGLKVGITRRTQVPNRWIDQGATAAIPLVEVASRLSSGQVEVLLKKHVADRTDWRKMLKGIPEAIDLVAEKRRLLDLVAPALAELGARVLDEPERSFAYPVLSYPEKVTSLGLEKTPEIASKLVGIKGQYLIFEAGVINVRSHAGYEVTLEEIHGT